MPHAEIVSANSDGEYQEPSERMHGAFHEYELRHCSDCLQKAEKIKSNPHLMKALAKHHATKAKEHGQMAEHMKRGLVSEKAADKATKASAKS